MSEFHWQKWLSKFFSFFTCCHFFLPPATWYLIPFYSWQQKDPWSSFSDWRKDYLTPSYVLHTFKKRSKINIGTNWINNLNASKNEDLFFWKEERMEAKVSLIKRLIKRLIIKRIVQEYVLYNVQKRYNKSDNRVKERKEREHVTASFFFYFFFFILKEFCIIFFSCTNVIFIPFWTISFFL